MSSRISLDFGLRAADLFFREFVVPELGRIWFVRQLSWPLAALALHNSMREQGANPPKPTAICHGIESLACKLEYLVDPASTPPRELTTVLALFQGRANRGAEWHAPRPRSPEWWLISHGFRAPAVRSNSYPWRYALPSLVHCALKPAHRLRDQRTSWGALAGFMQSETSNYVWSGLFDVAEQVARRLGPNHQSYSSSSNRGLDAIEELPPRVE